MGFKRKQRQYQMEFAEGPLAGLVISTRVPTLDQIEAISHLANTDVLSAPRPTPEMVAKIRRFCEAMSECITSWNLEDEDGTPIPCNKASLLAQDMEFLLPLSMGWLDAVNTGPEDRDLSSHAEVVESDDGDLASLPAITDPERVQLLAALLQEADEIR